MPAIRATALLTALSLSPLTPLPGATPEPAAPQRRHATPAPGPARITVTADDALPSDPPSSPEHARRVADVDLGLLGGDDDDGLITVCLDVDVVVSLRVGLSIGGPPLCHRPPPRPAPPPEPPPSSPPTREPEPAPTLTPAPEPSRPPAPTEPAPRPTSTPRPAPSATPTRAPVPPVVPSPRPPVRPPLALPSVVRPPVRQVPEPTPAPSLPSAEPSPSAVTPSGQVRAARVHGRMPRRPEPLGTIMVVIVLSLIIALVAGAAFAAIR
ncbi:hypothetical protein [Sphaerisporangium sp. NPDC051011]|uniref:hypothetical protein n=1 Tax=Sphaerisporangium sp. NPDC051011 TaxID=3155792 RepID=UPI00340A691C